MKQNMFLLVFKVALSVVSLVIAIADEKVSQIHIAQGLTPSSMTISWLTKFDISSVVKYGLKSDELNFSASGSITSYEFNYAPGYEQYKSGVIHHVYLNDLLPSSEYFYQCGNFSGEIPIISDLFSFRTMPAVGDAQRFTFGVFGDLGQSEDSKSTLSHVLKNPKLGMILHPGDLSYADCDAVLWDSYGEIIEPLAATRPWMVGPGNHEIEITNAGSMYAAFEARYRMPQIKPAELGPVYIGSGELDKNGNLQCCPGNFQSEYNYGNAFYSFEVASTHVIFLNCYSSSNETSIQYQWLESDFKAVNRTVTPWLIVVMHCPWYSSNIEHYGEAQTVIMRDAMEKLFLINKVNIVLTGHVHAYERTYPMYQNETRSDGVMYLTIGDGGCYGKTAGDYYEQPTWSAYRNGTQFGHGELTIVNKNMLIWRWLRNIDNQMVSQDQFALCNTYFGSSNCTDLNDENTGDVMNSMYMEQ